MLSSLLLAQYWDDSNKIVEQKLLPQILKSLNDIFQFYTIITINPIM